MKKAVKKKELTLKEQVAALNRNDLMSLYAEYSLTPPAGAEGGLAAKYSCMNAEELALRQKELELREKELNMKKAAKEKKLALKGTLRRRIAYIFFGPS